MTGTQYDHLLDLPNVVAVWVDEDGTVHTAVSEKVPEDDLDDADIVSHAVDAETETDVHDADLGAGADGFEPLVADPNEVEAQGTRHERHRPVVAGVSEIHHASTAATGGPYPARVVDTSKGEWADGTPEGLRVRLSNAHVYARSGQAAMGDHIVQPSPMDGGKDNADAVGGLIGYAPLTDGVTADVAARDVDDSQASSNYHDLPDEWPTSIRRENVSSLVGERLTKTGRTTGVTEAVVQGTGATVRVRYPGRGLVTLPDQLIAVTEDGHFSRGGDSGSPVFLEDGALVGLVFAGSSRMTAVSLIANVENELGVEVEAEPQDHETERSFEDYVTGLLEDEFGERYVTRQYRYPDDRRPDIVAFDEANSRVLVHELENDSGSLVNGSGQANYYQERAIDEWPAYDRVTGVLVFPEGHIDEDERTYLKRVGIELWEVPIPDDVSVEGV